MSKLIIFDVETTGTSTTTDQIIELGLKDGLNGPSRVWRIKPNIPIGEKAQEIHGISMDDLAGSPAFQELWDTEIGEYFTTADVFGGYNVKFDIEMIQSELRRFGLPEIDLSKKIVIDALKIWRQCEPRTLVDAHKRFAGYTFEGAHSAKDDVDATARVFEGMLEQFGLITTPWDEIEILCDPDKKRWVGPSNHFQWYDDGEYIFISFGKHKDMDIYSAPTGYFNWVRGQDFPKHVREIAYARCAMGEPQFYEWVENNYGTFDPN